MPKEQGECEVPITAIHINLKDRSVLFEAGDRTIAKLTFVPEGVIFFQPQQQPQQGEPSAPLVKPDSGLPEHTESEAATTEKELRLTLTGRLKTKPREGRPDRSGKPTAYARFTAHEEGQDKPHDYIATFHRQTTRVALNLPRDAQITASGYPHQSTSEKRLDTFSVINLLNYPGKPARK